VIFAMSAEVLPRATHVRVGFAVSQNGELRPYLVARDAREPGVLPMISTKPSSPLWATYASKPHSIKCSAISDAVSRSSSMQTIFLRGSATGHAPPRNISQSGPPVH
jgi:hypothetical protein